MKKMWKKSAVFLCVVVLILSLTVTVCCADGTATISSNKTNVKVGETVTLTVNTKAGAADPYIWGVSGTMNYDKSKLRFESSTATAKDNGGSLTFAVDGSGNSDKASVSFTFTVIGEGNASVLTKDVSYSGDVQNSKYSLPDQSVIVKATSVSSSSKSSSASSSKTSSVTSSKASSTTSSASSSGNASSKKTASANLASLKVSGGELSPAFSAGVTSYTVRVPYDVDKVSVTAFAADAGAQVDGTGTFDLSVGDNGKTVTVTAADGTKKTYSISIRRLNEGETVDEPAAGDPVPTDPLAVSVNGTPYHVVEKPTLPAPEGLAAAAGEYNGTEISVFADETGRLAVYELKNDETGAADYFTYRGDRDEFCQLHYLQNGGATCIFVDEPGEYDPPEDYFRTTVSLGNGSVDAYASKDEKLTDFYVVYCFRNGKFGYYRYDCAEGVMQRFPEFAPTEHIDAGETKPVSSFAELTSRAKMILLACGVATLLIVVLIVLLIVMLVRRKKRNDLYDAEEESDEFISRNRDMFRFDDDLPKASDAQPTFQTRPDESTNDTNE